MRRPQQRIKLLILRPILFPRPLLIQRIRLHVIKAFLHDEPGVTRDDVLLEDVFQLRCPLRRTTYLSPKDPDDVRPLRDTRQGQRLLGAQLVDLELEAPKVVRREVVIRDDGLARGIVDCPVARLGGILYAQLLVYI